MKIKKVLAATVLATTVASCTKTRYVPSTWSDVAATIPADVEFVAAVNQASDLTPLLYEAAGVDGSDVKKLVDTGLGLCTKKPTHLVVVGMSEAIFITWPLPNPSMVADNVAKWPKASLNNTVDAHIKTVGDVAIIVSDNQAWVVKSKKPVARLNDLLDGAMNANAAQIQPLSKRITTAPGVFGAVVRANDKYLGFGLVHGSGRLRIDFDVCDASGNPEVFSSALSPLERKSFVEYSKTSPFVAFGVAEGKLPDLLLGLVKIGGGAKAALAVRTIAPVFAEASGPVVASFTADRLDFEITYVSDSSAVKAARKFRTLAERFELGVQAEARKGVLKIHTESPGFVDGLEVGTPTPRRDIAVADPVVAGCARLRVDETSTADLFLEAKSSAGSLVIDYPEGEDYTERVFGFVKKLIPIYYGKN